MNWKWYKRVKQPEKKSNYKLSNFTKSHNETPLQALCFFFSHTHRELCCPLWHHKGLISYVGQTSDHCKITMQIIGRKCNWYIFLASFFPCVCKSSPTVNFQADLKLFFPSWTYTHSKTSDAGFRVCKRLTPLARWVKGNTYFYPGAIWESSFHVRS